MTGEQIYLVGTFPPPVHGMAAINQAVHRLLSAQGSTPIVLNTAASSLRRGVFDRLTRAPRIISALASLIFTRNLGLAAIYIGLSGGLGQLYDVLAALVGRCRGARLFLHHHSFAYLHSIKWQTRLLVWCAGPHATHVVLSPGMGRLLKSRYPRVGRVFELSNASLLLKSSELSTEVSRGLRTLGFLSNISGEKGVFEFLDLCEALDQPGSYINALLAGPFQDQHTEQLVRTRLKSLSNVTYLGPVYGPAKEAFFEGIDVLVFPSKYANEAEPLTVLEALRAGVPVVAYGRGTIPELLTGHHGLCVTPGTDFVSTALPHIKEWQGPENLRRASAMAREKFEQLYRCSSIAAQDLLMEMKKKHERKEASEYSLEANHRKGTDL